MAHISIYWAGRICPLMQAHFLSLSSLDQPSLCFWKFEGLFIYLFLSDGRKMTPSPETVSDL